MNANIWQPAASGHLLPGETYAEAARRELREEIGSSFARKVKALHPIKQVHIYTDETTSPYPQRENFSFFIASIDEDTSNGVATNYEAGSAAWMDVSTIKDMLARHPEEFRDAFRIAFDTIDWDTLSETQIHTVEKH